MSALVIFTDLDGTLLDASTFSCEPAREALRVLRAHAIPLVLVSSKTRAEMEPIRRALDCRDPFVVENGSAVFVPAGYFQFSLNGAGKRGGCDVVEFGTSYAVLRRALTNIRAALGARVRGFGDMSVKEVAALTGLSRAEAWLAMQREYDEPFVLEGPPRLLEEVRRLADARGLRCTSGGRFHHLMGPSDKGRACTYLIECYRRYFKAHSQPLATVAVGDSQNDLSMLAAVERPILVRLADGSYDPAIDLPNLTRAPGIGPAGWNAAIMRLLGNSFAGPRGDESSTQDIPGADG